jgi:hypothetical protein
LPNIGALALSAIEEDKGCTFVFGDTTGNVEVFYLEKNV